MEVELALVGGKVKVIFEEVWVGVELVFRSRGS